MDKELFEGLVKHVKKHGVKSTEITTIIRSSLVVPVGNLEVELTLKGIKNMLLGTISWNEYIWVADLTNDRPLGRLLEDGYKSHTHSYTYKGVKDLEEVITRLEADYQEFKYKIEQEALERKSEEEILEERVNDFLYKG